MSEHVVRKTDRNRKKLRELLPLESPLGVAVECSSICNFKCRFCPQGHGFDREYPGGLIDFDLFKKIINDFKQFPQKPGVLNLSYRGEPLLHPRIADIVKYAVDSKAVEEVEIFTNASQLTHDVSDRLIEAGLDIINISIEGLSDEAYKSVTGVEISYDDIVEKVRYFFEHKTNTEVYVKIISQLCSEEEKNTFRKTFESICDYYDIEDIVDCWQNDINDTLYHTEKQKMKERYEKLIPYRRKVCPEPFYKFIALYDGLVVSCVEDYKQEYVMGDLRKETALNIWNGEKFNKFRYAQCIQSREDYSICNRDCYKYKDIRHLDEDPDNIDNLDESIINQYKVK